MGVRFLSDESLLAGLSSGDPEGSAAFVRRFQGRVAGLALSIVGDSSVAEEVAQEAFLRAWRHGAAFDPSGAFILPVGVDEVASVVLVPRPSGEVLEAELPAPRN